MRATVRACCRFVVPLLCLLHCGAQTAGADLHDPWDRLLKTYVDDEGKVAYRGLQQKDLGTLDAYLASLAKVDPSAMSRDEQLALWINAYNAMIVKGVLLGYSAEGFLGRKRFFGYYSQPIGGEERTPDEIENEILRPRFAEARVHFAIVCASTSCPKLRREAYRGAVIDAQLDDQARKFLGDPSRNQFGKGVIRISRIFEWFAEDFEPARGSVLAYLRQYISIEDEPRIEYLDYDWTMNAQPGQRPE